MQTAEGLQGRLTSEELETALRVLDPLHTQEPHQEVEPVHQDGSEQGPLSQRELNQIKQTKQPHQAKQAKSWASGTGSRKAATGPGGPASSNSILHQSTGASARHQHPAPVQEAQRPTPASGTGPAQSCDFPFIARLKVFRDRNGQTVLGPTRWRWTSRN